MIETPQQIVERQARQILLAHHIEIGDDPRSRTDIAMGLGLLLLNDAVETSAPPEQSAGTTV